MSELAVPLILPHIIAFYASKQSHNDPAVFALAGKLPDKCVTPHDRQEDKCKT